MADTVDKLQFMSLVIFIEQSAAFFYSCDSWSPAIDLLHFLECRKDLKMTPFDIVYLMSR